MEPNTTVYLKGRILRTYGDPTAPETVDVQLTADGQFVQTNVKNLHKSPQLNVDVNILDLQEAQTALDEARSLADNASSEISSRDSTIQTLEQKVAELEQKIEDLGKTNHELQEQVDAQSGTPELPEVPTEIKYNMHMVEFPEGVDRVIAVKTDE